MIVVYFDADQNSYCFNCAVTSVADITARVFEEENPLPLSPFVSYRKIICTNCGRLIGNIKLV